jgi:type II secretory pathway pseudopilin PulG
VTHSSRGQQQGAALIVLLALVAIAITALLITAIAGTGTTAEQEEQTARALAIAHEALINYAVSVQPDTDAKRPGDLPCPDLDNDGDAEPTCSSLSSRIGRLPVKTLELPDLVDGYGERLWYALSSTFDRSTMNQCPDVGASSCLNSDTRGTITVRSETGATLHNGTGASGAIAVVFSPGPPLTRLGASTPQDRGCTGDSNVALCQQTRRCSDTTKTTAMCNPVNYLDRVGAPLPSEDNADFWDSSNTNGLIQGPVFDTGGNLILNDRLLVLRYEDLMPKLEQRVAREALRCLQDYALANGNRYPWAAPVSSDYRLWDYPLTDSTWTRFGRLPNVMPASHASPYYLDGAWGANCPITMSLNQHKWWANWQNLVFYGVASGYAPNASPTGCGSCLTVNAPAPADKQVVVLVAGRRFTGQTRGVGASLPNYLEDVNATGGNTFKKAPASGSFNDQLVFR